MTVTVFSLSFSCCPLAFWAGLKVQSCWLSLSLTKTCVAPHLSPVAVGHDQAVWLSAGLLTLPAHQPLLACPAPPLAGRFLLIVIVPRQPEGDKNKKKERVRKKRIFLFFFKTSNPSFSSALPQFSFTVRDFKGNDSLNWTVIIAVTEPGGFVDSFLFFFSPLSSWPVSCATTNTSYRGCSFHELIKTQSGDMAWLRIRESRGTVLVLVWSVLKQSKLERFVRMCEQSKPLKFIFLQENSNLITFFLS